MRGQSASGRGNNGATADLNAFALASAVSYDDPMAKVLGLDARTSSARAWFGFTSGGTILMAACLSLASVVAWMHTAKAEKPDKPDEIDVSEEAPPPPPPPVATAEPAPEPKPAAAPPPRAAPESPPPAPAQAARVLAREPDPNEPVDLTGNTIVQGNAEAFAGGFTASNGTGTGAVHSLPSPTAGVPGGAGPAQPAPPAGPDRSRTASLGAGGEWSCPFPSEADTSQVDEAYVTLQVDVRADGTPGAVRVISDPGSGFGREARRCAMNKRYNTALDHDGNSVAGATRAFRVHFSR